jgi:predicted nuclease of predicted toxin-antitoxin system
MTTVRFQADADLKQAIVTGVVRQQPTIDFQSAHAADLEGKSDQEVLTIAAQSNRILVTHDRKTMPAEFGKFIVTQTSSGVLILSQKLPMIDAIETLILIWEASTLEEWVNQIMSVPF